MLEKFIKSYSGTYRHTAMIRHKGMVIAFAMDNHRRIFYTILDLGGNDAAAGAAQKPKSSLDVDAWQSAATELIFPNEIAEVGFGVADQTMLPVFKKNSAQPEVAGTVLPPGRENEFDYFKSTTARFTEDAPFQVLTDGRYVYIFRQAITGDVASMVYVDQNGNILVNKNGEKGYVEFDKEASKNIWRPATATPTPLVNATLLVDRFLLMGTKLASKMEVRFQRSRSKTRPASRKDSLGPKDLDGNIFYEPTQELRFISSLKSGHFSVLLLPTAIAEIQRWQIFAENGITGRMDSYNVERSADGLFNTRGTRTYTCEDHPRVYAKRAGTCTVPECGKTLIPRIVTQGYAESAMEFDGVGDHIHVEDKTRLNVTEAITVEAWIKPNQNVKKSGVVVGTAGYSLSINEDGKLVFSVTTAQGQSFDASSKVMVQDTWYHVAGTFDGTAARIFVNGNEDGNEVVYGRLKSADGNLYIGRSSGAPANPFAGVIDETRLWERARSSAEMRADMHQRLTGLEPDIVGYWRFDEGSGHVVHDHTNHLLDGTAYYDENRRVDKDIKWTQSDARVGEHPGIERASFAIAGRSFKSAPTSLLYYQQSKAPSGYSGEQKPLKNAGRVMLAVATNDGIDAAKNHIAALDFGVSASGRLAQIPDEVKLEPINAEDSNNQSLNEKLDEISGLQTELFSLNNDISRLADSIARISPIISTLNNALDDPASITANIAEADFSYLNAKLNTLMKADAALESKTAFRRRLDDQLNNAGMYVYQDADYKGSQLGPFKFASPDISYDYLKDNNFNDQISSIRLDEPLQVVVYEHAKRDGDSTTFLASADYVGKDWNEKISSMEVQENPAFASKRTNAITAESTAKIAFTEAETAVSDEKKELDDRLSVLQQEKTAKETLRTLAQNKLSGIQSGLLNGASATMPRLHTDPLGLTISGGWLGFAWTDDAPLLFDSATGSLALYFRGRDDQFFVAYFDTFTEWARITLLADGKDAVSCFSRSTAYEKITMEIEGEEAATCTVSIYYGNSKAEFIIKETWEKIPRSASEFAKVLNGQASGHTYIGSGRIVEGDLILSSPGGARRAVNAGATLMVGNERITAKQISVGDTTVQFEGSLTSTETLPVFFVEYDYPENASCAGLTSAPDMSNGSVLLRAIPAEKVEKEIGNQVVELAASQVCKWTAAAPGSTLVFDGRTQFAQPGTSVNPEHFDATGDLTLEAWVKPSRVKDKARVIQHHTANSNYVLALEKNELMSAMKLDGVNNYISIPKSNPLNFSGAITIEAWIKPEAIDGTRNIVAHGYPFAGTGELVLRMEDEKYEIGIWHKTRGNILARFPIPVEDGTGRSWVHLAGVYDENTQEWILYRNGIDVSSTESTYGANEIDADWGIGANANPNETIDLRIFKGSVDEIRIWKKTRTQQEIQSDMNRRLIGNETGLVGYWHFENGEARDYSRYQNNGKVTGDPKQAASPLPAYTPVAGVGKKFVKARGITPAGNWTHLAAAFDQAYGLQFDGGDTLDCGNDTTLDINQDLTIEAFLMIGAAHELEESLAKLHPKAYATLRDLAESNPILKNLLEGLASEAETIHDVLRTLASLDSELHALLQDLYNALRVEQVVIRRGMFEDGEADQNVPYSLSLNAANQLVFAFEDIQGGLHQYTSDVIKAGYHRLAVTRKRETRKDPIKDKVGKEIDTEVTAWDEITFYVNGNKHGQFKYESAQPQTDKSRQPVDVGNSNKPVTIGNKLNGVIAEIRVWNTTREQADIGKNLTGNEKGLVSWWRFQEGSGNKAFDSKSRNHATINGAQWVKSPDPQGSSLKLYVNGQLKETDAIDSAAWMASTADGQFTLGARKSGGGHGEYFQGEMEEARVWQTTRTEEQIQDNLFLRIQGERVDLVAYYTFDAESGDQISDHSLRGNHLGVLGGTNRVLSTAPIGNDTPQVRSALAGIRTPFSGRIESAPAVQEYGDMQFDSQGNLIGVFKRCYSFILDGKWQIVTGYKVGDMVTEWIGQVQFAPQLIGYIEGTPPVPSENLTQPSVELIGDMDDYSEASFIELAEAQETTYTYSATKEGGFDMEVDLGLKLGFKSKTDAGAFLITSVEESKVLVGIRAHFEAAWGWSEEASTGVSRTAGKTTSLELRGRFTTPEETTSKREPFGRRFVPDNVGLALVQSETADVFALRLKHNGALISYQMRANPDIPKDWNIIHFPINPRYVKQGTLDGKIGSIADVDHPNALTYSSDSSYFKPIEAYALKNRIQREETALETYYAQYAAQDKGRPASMPSESVRELAGFQALAQKLHRNLINTYVWTTDGGLFAETQQTMDVQSETHGGSYDFKWMAGFDLAIAFAIAKVASVFELNAMFGGHSHLSVSKSKESKTSFQLNVNLDKVERDIYKRDLENHAIVLLDESDPKRPIKFPGKVDAYRFMSFYLEPESDHHEQFYNLVVDPNWLEKSGDPGAVALREARQPGKEPPCWRVMHRVTYVSRVLAPLDKSAPPSMEKSLQTLDIDSNYELIKQLEPYVRDHLADFADFSTAVDDALKINLPELRPHSRQIKEYLSLYYGIEEGYSPEPKAGVGSEAPEFEEVPENQPPTVTVGIYPDVLLLTGETIEWTPDPKKTTVRDDRLEKTEDIFLTWEFLPNEEKGQQADDVEFDDPHTLATTAKFTEKGQYTLRLTASDGIRSAYAETVIIVNQTPVIESITAGLPTRNTSAEELSWTVDLECEIQSELGDPSAHDGLIKTWNIISGSEGAEVEIVSTVPKEDNDEGVLMVRSQATFLQSGYYRLEFTVSNGIEATSPIDLEIAARVTDGLQVLYTFETKEGQTVDDVSGIGSPLDLFISNPDSISWINDGLVLQAPTSLFTKAERLVKALKASNALSLEAWIKPTESNAQGLRRILTLSNGPAKRNFILAQNESAYHAGLRTTDGPVTDFNASLKSLVGGVTDVNRLAHVVFTRDAKGNAQLFVDGESVSDRTINGDFSKWDENFQLALGNEFNSEGRSESDRAWLGEYHLMAIYDRALTTEEVKQNFEFGADRDLPPQVFAGDHREINWSVEGVSHTNSDGRLIVQMHGRITHDRPISGSSEWTKVSGPRDGIVTFDDKFNPQTEAYFSRSGVYTLRLTANDGKQLVSKEVTVKITHEVPNVSINITDANLIITAEEVNTVTIVDEQASLKLDGVITNSLENEYPVGKRAIEWACDSKDVDFDDKEKLGTTVTFPRNGVYELTLTAINPDEKKAKESDTITITVNRVPFVDAGPDQTLYLFGQRSVATYLDGTVSDDGLPETPGIIKLKWSVQDAQGGAKIKDVTIGSEDEDFTDVQFKREGVYTLKLEASDGAVTVSDTVTINIKTAPDIPDGGVEATVIAETALNVRKNHEAENDNNILYRLRNGDKVTIINYWQNKTDIWVQLKPDEKHPQKTQWCALKVGENIYLEVKINLEGQTIGNISNSI